MEQKEIKIKSYQYFLQNLLILFTVVSAIFFAIMLVYGISVDGFDYKAIILISIFVPIIGLLIMGTFITRFACRTYDIYSEFGIKRVRGKKVVFNVKWDNIGSTIYFPLLMIVILMPNILIIDFKVSLTDIEYREPDCKTSVSTPMSKKILKEILSLMPEVNQTKFYKENSKLNIKAE